MNESRISSSRVAVFVALVACAASGCGASLTVVRQSGPPSALANAQTLGVLFDYSALVMGGVSEASWFAQQPPADQEAYQLMRGSMEAAFITALGHNLPGVRVVRATGQEPAVLVVRHTRIEMGFWAFAVSRPSELDSTLVFSVAGEVTDELSIRTRESASMSNPTASPRMQACAEDVGELAAEYVMDARSS